MLVISQTAFTPNGISKLGEDSALLPSTLRHRWPWNLPQLYIFLKLSFWGGSETEKFRAAGSALQPGVGLVPSHGCWQLCVPQIWHWREAMTCPIPGSVTGQGLEQFRIRESVPAYGKEWNEMTFKVQPKLVWLFGITLTHSDHSYEQEYPNYPDGEINLRKKAASSFCIPDFQLSAFLPSQLNWCMAIFSSHLLINTFLRWFAIHTLTKEQSLLCSWLEKAPQPPELLPQTKPCSPTPLWGCQIGFTNVLSPNGFIAKETMTIILLKEPYPQKRGWDWTIRFRNILFFHWMQMQRLSWVGEQLISWSWASPWSPLWLQIPTFGWWEQGEWNLTFELWM